MERDCLIRVYKSVAGWRALQIWYNPEGFWEPYQTGLQAYETRQEAINEAVDWAASEGIRLEIT